MTTTSTKSVVATLFILFCLTTASAQVSLTVLNSAAAQDFNTLAAAGTSSALPAGWTFLESGTNANATYRAGSGTDNAGDTYSFGATGNTERAFGTLRSGTLIPIIGASFSNNTGAIITGFTINYTGEQWRLGVNGRPAPDKLLFQYSLNAASLNSGTWIAESSLDFAAPKLSASPLNLVGNDPANRVSLTATISGLAIPPGATFWIRWTDLDISGSDDGLSVDDFAITPHGVPVDEPNITFTPASLAFGQLLLGSSKTLTYSFDGDNLDNPLTTVTSTNSGFEISLDGASFTNTVDATDGTTIYVRFAPAADGLASGSLQHSNGAFTKTFSAQGTGYDPLLHIIPIAAARGMTVGSIVTVTGRVTSANQLGSPSYLQDGTGGIPVFDFNLSNNVEIGDSLVVTGPIGTFSQQVQISGSGISFFKADNTTRLIEPKPILLNQLAANEGILVTVQNVELVNKSFVFYPQSTERMTDGTIQADLRIDGDTDIPGLTKPQGLADITGVVGRFNANAQLLPRFRDDVPGATEPHIPADTIPVTSTFDLMNWNLEFFGAEREDYSEEFGPVDEPLQLANVKQVILSASPDIIAVQEVSADAFFNTLVSELPGYAGICSDRWSHSFDEDGSFPPQKVCFIYNTSTVDVISARPMFEQLYDEARTSNPALLPGIPGNDASSFWSSGRLPFMLTADITIEGVRERINFINLHSKSGAALADYNRRKYDMQVLKDSLDAHNSSEQFVILGDINDDLDNSITTGQPTPYATIVNDEAGYSPITLSLSEAGAKSTISFNDVIDHQILSNELDEEYIPGSVRIITPFGLIANYANTTSDHLPVLSRYQFITPEVSFDMSSGSVVEGETLAVQLSLSRPASIAGTITIAVSGDAIYGDDYSTVPGASQTISVPLAEGATSVSFAINTIDDITDEPAELVAFNVVATEGITAGEQPSFLLTILDNDLPSISFDQASMNVEEGQTATISMVLTSASPYDQTVTIGFDHTRGLHYPLDYSTSPSPHPMWKMTFSIPRGATEATFDFTADNDFFEEGDETVTYTILSISDGMNLGSASSLAVTITDVDPCRAFFVLHPNPTQGQVRIWTIEANENKIVNGTLFDPNGEIVVTASGTVEELNEAFSAAMTGKRRGIYIVKLQMCDQVVTLRLVKL
jgi:hypothetical protein